MTHHEHIRLEIADGRAVLTLDRPPLNVLNIAMMREMTEALGEAGAVGDLRLLVLRSRGKAFSAGVDVGEHVGDLAKTMIETFDGLLAALLDFPLPTVALVDGAALGGGCEVVLACDLVYATERSKFGQPEVKVGVYPPPATVLLPPLVGRRRTAEIVLTGEVYSAAEARDLGIVNRVYPAEEFETGTERILGSIQALSGSVLRMTVERLRSGGPFREEMAAVEEHYLTRLMRTKDAAEGLAAFLEKRAPRWTHE